VDVAFTFNATKAYKKLTNPKGYSKIMIKHYTNAMQANLEFPLNDLFLDICDFVSVVTSLFDSFSMNQTRMPIRKQRFFVTSDKVKQSRGNNITTSTQEAHSMSIPQIFKY
jgi:hypothetical protein